jgi:hypothetical protein
MYLAKITILFGSSGSNSQGQPEELNRVFIYMDVFKLSRNFFDWSFENPEKITPTHSAILFILPPLPLK